jgi:hypothetical protein
MTLSDLRQDILTRLGSPVINIELAPGQMDLYIKDTIDRFIEVHYDGLDEGVIFLNVTPETTEYELPGNIHTVMEIMTSPDGITVDEPLLVDPFIIKSYVGDYGSGYGQGHFSYLDIEMYDQNMAMWRKYGSGSQTMFQYNSTTGKLKLFVAPKVDGVLALKVHAAPDTFETIYENAWVKKYATALCQIAWAQNISKYEGGTLPGGVTLNFVQILAEGKESKEFLETELYERYQEPIDFFFA